MDLHSIAAMSMLCSPKVAAASNALVDFLPPSPSVLHHHHDSSCCAFCVEPAQDHALSVSPALLESRLGSDHSDVFEPLYADSSSSSNGAEDGASPLSESTLRFNPEPLPLPLPLRPQTQSHEKKCRNARACTLCRKLKQTCDGNGRDPCSRCTSRLEPHLCIYALRKKRCEKAAVIPRQNVIGQPTPEDFQNVSCSPHVQGYRAILRQELVAKALFVLRTHRQKRTDGDEIVRMISAMDDETLRCVADELTLFQEDEDMRFTLTNSLESVVERDAGFRSAYLRCVDYIESSSRIALLLDTKGGIVHMSPALRRESPFSVEDLRSGAAGLQFFFDPSDVPKHAVKMHVIRCAHDRNTMRSVVQVSFRQTDGTFQPMFGAITFLRTSKSRFNAALGLEMIPMPKGFVNVGTSRK
eukprot:ANDGO_00930.mRNA.1 hypothetical protein